jgi:hypothetical protein
MCVPSLESERPEEPEQKLCELEERSITVAVATTVEREPEAPCDEHSSNDAVAGSHLFFKSNRLLIYAKVVPPEMARVKMAVTILVNESVSVALSVPFTMPTITARETPWSTRVVQNSEVFQPAFKLSM